MIGSMEEIEHLADNYDENWLPEWAKKRSSGYQEINSALQTRDGRRTGNAVVVGHMVRHGVGVAQIVTDAGNIIYLTPNEMEELFYPPQYVMLTLLPAHETALYEEKVTGS